MLIAVVGCCHGELDVIYQTLKEAESHLERKVELLLICGDFQAVRNEDDLECLACPPKYRSMNTFYKYYSGEAQAPVLTLFIGGNHEASNYLQELPLGGWVAPQIYYMGYAGVVRVGNLRIGGLSGIYNGRDYRRERYEQPPYTESTLRSVYHVRETDVKQLSRLSGSLDVMISHDWPSRITEHGDLQRLLDRKSFLRDDIAMGKLGSPPLDDLIQELKPSYFFSAHIHVKFPAVVQHADGRATRFLALSKPLPGQDFLQVVDIPDVPSADKDDDGFAILKRDPEWLTILRCSEPEKVEEGQVQETIAMVGSNDVVNKDEFVRTARVYSPMQAQRGMRPTELRENTQTKSILELIGLSPKTEPNTSMQQTSGGKRPRMELPPPTANVPQNNPEEIDIDMDDVEEEVQEDQVEKALPEPLQPSNGHDGGPG